MTRVSIIIPCFNDGLYLQESVMSAIDQTYDDVEILVIDDGSDDPATLHQLANLPRHVQTLRQPNSGVSCARNTAIAASSGEYILPLDADDLLEATFVADAVGVLDGGRRSESSAAEPGSSAPRMPSSDQTSRARSTGCWRTGFLCRASFDERTGAPAGASTRPLRGVRTGICG